LKVEELRELAVLEAIENDARLTQRSLASTLGIALGLTNLYLKRLVRKGYIKCVNVRSNRLLYLITPKGIAEKTRLTYEFVDYSLDLYRRVRQNLKAVLDPLTRSGHTSIAIYGTGEAAELAYLSLREQGLEPVAIFDAEAGSQFLGMPVLAVTEPGRAMFDRVIVASLEDGETVRDELLRCGVSADRILLLGTTLQQPLSAGWSGGHQHRD
jgi:DNA-binding MarR family transcriptional regulator